MAPKNFFIDLFLYEMIKCQLHFITNLYKILYNTYNITHLIPGHCIFLLGISVTLKGISVIPGQQAILKIESLDLDYVISLTGTTFATYQLNSSVFMLKKIM
jgi:hypothetical protein